MRRHAHSRRVAYDMGGHHAVQAKPFGQAGDFLKKLTLNPEEGELLVHSQRWQWKWLRLQFVAGASRDKGVIFNYRSARLRRPISFTVVHWSALDIALQVASYGWLRLQNVAGGSRDKGVAFNYRSVRLRRTTEHMLHDNRIRTEYSCIDRWRSAPQARYMACRCPPGLLLRAKPWHVLAAQADHQVREQPEEGRLQEAGV